MKPTAKKIFPGRLYDAFFMNEYGRIESMRASRYNSNFSIILIGAENTQDQPHSGCGIPLEFIEKAAAALIGSVRNSDVAGTDDDGHLIVILPETDYLGSLNAARKISKSFGVVFNKGTAQPSFVITSATFPKDGSGYGELLGVALKRADMKKRSIWRKQGFGEKLFWEIISDLSARSYTDLENSSFDAGEGYHIPRDLVCRINEFIIREMTRTPQKKGVLYLSAGEMETPFANDLNAAGRLSARTFIIGGGGEKLYGIRNATPLPIDDHRLKETSLTLYLSEDTGYALICRENWGGAYSCFHSSDPFLVEGLISKFQAEYSLQEQFG